MHTRGTINISTYSCKLTVIFTDKSVKDAANRIYKKYKDPTYLEHEVVGRAMTPASCNDYFIIIKVVEGNKININTLVHEINHIKNYVLSDVNVHYSPLKDEAGCYLAGHIAGHIYKLMKKKGIEFL